MLWTTAPEIALDGAARSLFYAAVVTLTFVSLRDRRLALGAARGLTAALGVLSTITLIAILSDGPAQFLAGRLDAPVGYRNGTAALMVLAAIALLCAAAHKRGAPLVRGLAFSAATTALAMAYATQSRGALIGFAAGAAVVLALGPDRLRRAWLLILAVCAVALVSGDLLAPYQAFLDGAPTAAAISDAGAALALLAFLSLAVGAAIALFDGGLRLTGTAERNLRATGAVVLALLSFGAVAGGLAVAGDPVELLRDKVSEFKSLDAAAPGETRFGSTGGQRYDLWRIAWREFEANPLAGGGEGSYSVAYYQQRVTDRNLSTPHSLPLRVLAELGIVGLLLLLASLVVAPLLAVSSRWRDLPENARRWSSAMFGAAAVLISQTTVDWLWLIAGLSALALAALAIGVRIITAPQVPQPPVTGPVGAVATRAVPALATIMLALLFVSTVDVRTARTEQAAGNPEKQLAAARSAERLNPFALAPRYLQAGALESLERRDDARAELRAALDREPQNYVTLALLGDLETRAGRGEQARRWYRRALALNPGDVGLQQLAAPTG